jgi:hypothetical protein
MNALIEWSANLISYYIDRQDKENELFYRMVHELLIERRETGMNSKDDNLMEQVFQIVLSHLFESSYPETESLEFNKKNMITSALPLLLNFAIQLGNEVYLKWCSLILSKLKMCKNSDHEIILLTYIVLFDCFLDPKKPLNDHIDNFNLLDIRRDDFFWETIQTGLTAGNYHPISFKYSKFLIKRVIDFSVNNPNLNTFLSCDGRNYKWPCYFSWSKPNEYDCTQNTPQDIRKVKGEEGSLIVNGDLHNNVNGSTSRSRQEFKSKHAISEQLIWYEYLALVEILQDVSPHLIYPILPQLSTLLDPKLDIQGNVIMKFHSSWLIALVHIGLENTSIPVRKTLLKFIFETQNPVFFGILLEHGAFVSSNQKKLFVIFTNVRM